MAGTEKLHATIDGMTDYDLAAEIRRLLIRHRDKGLSRAESQLYDLLIFARTSREDADAERPDNWKCEKCGSESGVQECSECGDMCCEGCLDDHDCTGRD